MTSDRAAFMGPNTHLITTYGLIIAPEDVVFYLSPSFVGWSTVVFILYLYKTQ